MIAEHLQVPQATALSSVTIGEGDHRHARHRLRHRAGQRDAAGRHLDHRSPPGCPVPELQGHHGGEEEAVRDRVAGRPRRRRRPVRGRAVDHDGGRREAPRGAGIKIVDEGDAGDKLAAFLVENRLA
jgi:electron transfer flavoprotein beta subunit